MADANLPLPGGGEINEVELCRSSDDTVTVSLEISGEDDLEGRQPGLRIDGQRIGAVNRAGFAGGSNF
ncbi:MAG TPA: hypothetical protein VGC14_06080 [Rhizobium sp.]